MDVAFVLRNILEVPEVQLEGYLQHLGDPLEGWSMELCGKCEETVVKAKLIHQEMMDAKTRFKEVKFEIISKIMSIQQGIKCAEMKPEVETETTEYGEGTSLDNWEQAQGSVGEDPMEMEEMDEEAGQVSDNENLQEFHFNVKTEPQQGQGELMETPGRNSGTEDLVQEQKQAHSSRKKKRPSKKKWTRTSNDSDTLGASRNAVEVSHGLVMKGRKRLPKAKEGPVECKCGKQYRDYHTLLRHVKEVLRGSEMRCEICFRQQPSKLMTFKRKFNLTRHIQTVHEGKRSVCRYCEKEFNVEYFREHLKICPRDKTGNEGQLNK